jgi:hypothetical protein
MFKERLRLNKIKNDNHTSDTKDFKVDDTQV